METTEMVKRIQTIEIDCPPGSPRPDSYLESVLKDTGIEPVNATAKTFGNWLFDFDHIPMETWNKANPTIKERLISLYNSGFIRYASW